MCVVVPRELYVVGGASWVLEVKVFGRKFELERPLPFGKFQALPKLARVLWWGVGQMLGSASARLGIPNAAF